MRSRILFALAAIVLCVCAAVLILRREDPSIVFDTPWLMNSGARAYNGTAYDVAALQIEPDRKVVLPDSATVVERSDQADVLLVYMAKSAWILAHYSESVSIAEYRKTMGCAVKLEKGALLVGTFGEYSFMEGAVSMSLLVLVPPNVEVERRAGLIGGPGGRAGSQRNPNAINPAHGDPKPALTKFKEGTPRRWLPPTAEDGWHEIPAVPDVDRRVSNPRIALPPRK